MNNRHLIMVVLHGTPSELIHVQQILMGLVSDQRELEIKRMEIKPIPDSK